MACWKKSRFEMEGIPQGIECKSERFLFANQALPEPLLLLKSTSHGKAFEEENSKLPQLTSWMFGVQSGPGEIRFGKKTEVVLEPTDNEMREIKAGLIRLSELLLEAGAEWVIPGVFGAERIHNLDALKIWAQNPTTAKTAFLGAGHLFGGACLGESTPVNSDFQVRGIQNLFVADASLLPSSTGTNPALAIMTLGRLAAQKAYQLTN